jgi:hypothetical protein
MQLPFLPAHFFTGAEARRAAAFVPRQQENKGCGKIFPSSVCRRNPNMWYAGCGWITRSCISSSFKKQIEALEKKQKKDSHFIRGRYKIDV